MITRRAFLGAGTSVLALAALPERLLVGGGSPWAPLQRHLQGELVLPSDARYPTAKQLDLVQFDVISPRAIAYCINPTDVSLCLAFAQDRGMPFAVRSGGHSTGGYSTTEGLVVDVSRLDSITVGNGTVSVGPGAELVDITTALAPAGLAMSGGYCPTVAAGGYLQGGGIGPLTRHVGIASDTVTAAEVILADGRRVTASALRNPDLYWAIRGGGGGNFGVVTSYTFRPSPVTQMVVVNLAWSYDRAVDMLDGWARWLADAPTTIGGAAIVTLPDAAAGAVPTPAVLLVSVGGGGAELDAEIARLISLTGAPVFQRVTPATYQATMMGFYGCAAYTTAQCHRVGASPEGVLARPAWALQRSRLSRSMPRAAWEQAVAVFDAVRTAGQTHQLRVLALGGAANAPARTATAYVHRDSLFSANFVAQVTSPPVPAGAPAAGQQWVDLGFDTIDPYSNGESYQNFIDPALPDWRRSYYAENYPRLARVKAAYDPHGAFEFAQGID